MKKLFLSLTGIFLAAIMMAQAPNAIKYQAVARDGDGKVIANQEVNLTISILQGSKSGIEVFTETHDSTTNAYGLVTLNIGAGNPTDFANIDWSDGPYFVKVEMDGSLMGTSQLLSVPYAKYADEAGNVFSGSYNDLTDVPTNLDTDVTDDFDGNYNNLTNIPDLATKTALGDSTAQVRSEIPDVSGFLTSETDPSVPTGTQSGEMQYWDGTEWITVEPGNSGEILLFINGKPTWGIQGMEDGDVYNPTTGKIWMDRNLGALQVATSSTDANAYGNFYQWGRAADGHQIKTSNTTSTLATSDTPEHDDFITNSSPPYDWRNPQNDNLWQGVSDTNNPCPSGYRLPTEAEWEAERASWSSNDAAGAFASPLKLPVTGYRNHNDGSVVTWFSVGYYWSSTVDGTNSRRLNISSSNANMVSNYRADGFSVRCIKD